jgi:hypothetical protein
VFDSRFKKTPISRPKRFDPVIARPTGGTVMSM